MSRGLRNPLPGEPHVWRLSLEPSSEEITRLQMLLSDAERRRAVRFRRPIDRIRYTTAHARMREILSGYLGTAPRAIRLGEGASGKPHLIRSRQPSLLEFNLSHSQGQALLAVSLGQPVGVDVECINSDTGVSAIAERYFSDSERAALRADSTADRVDRFFQLWVCKEAYVKARGETILDRLSSFAIEIDLTGQARLVEDAREPAAPAHWEIRLLSWKTGIAAAIASKKPLTGVVIGDWPVDSRG